jgi:hypothetical protein
MEHVRKIYYEKGFQRTWSGGGNFIWRGPNEERPIADGRTKSQKEEEMYCKVVKVTSYTHDIAWMFYTGQRHGEYISCNLNG